MEKSQNNRKKYICKNLVVHIWSALRKKCPYSELFWSAFFRIRTRITSNTDTFYAVIIFIGNSSLSKLSSSVNVVKTSASQNFSFSFYFFNNALKLQKWSVFNRKNWNLFINTALLQLDRRLVPYLYLLLKNEIMFF